LAEKSGFKRVDIIRFVRFCIVGLTGVVVNAGLFHVFCTFSTIDYRIASLFSIEIAILNNFAWNYHWTFGDRKRSGLKSILSGFIRFNVSSGLTAMIVNWGILISLKEIAGLNQEIANLFGIAAGAASNYLMSHLWVFKKARV
jgi:dolichol-phosphate mannosyltransferase